MATSTTGTAGAPQGDATTQAMQQAEQAMQQASQAGVNAGAAVASTSAVEGTGGSGPYAINLSDYDINAHPLGDSEKQ